MPVTFLLLGCGYTARRVAEQLLDSGENVIATTRNPARLADLTRRGGSVLRLEATDSADLRTLRQAIPSGAWVLDSIPALRTPAGWRDPSPALMEALDGRAVRIVYLSTTGVYGDARLVDETTAPAPRNRREAARLEAEHAVQSGSWQAMILRPAAIYGPGRGVHASMRDAKYFLAGDGSNYISRIHVDDLAAHAMAALRADLTGAWPVADEEPCPAREIAAFCAELLGIPMPPCIENPPEEDTRRANRRVDGSAIRRALGVSLRYPSYRTGIPACLEAEAEGVR
jgi:nucleoside-diphosphate-sugar epimerase